MHGKIGEMCFVFFNSDESKNKMNPFSSSLT